jgi:hypothetical protein
MCILSEEKLRTDKIHVCKRFVYFDLSFLDSTKSGKRMSTAVNKVEKEKHSATTESNSASQEKTNSFSTGPEKTLKNIENP